MSDRKPTGILAGPQVGSLLFCRRLGLSLCRFHLYMRLYDGWDMCHLSLQTVECPLFTVD